MHHSIGPSAAHNGYRAFQHLTNRGFQHLLYAKWTKLPLPASIIAAVVANVKEESQVANQILMKNNQ